MSAVEHRRSRLAVFPVFLPPPKKQAGPAPGHDDDDDADFCLYHLGRLGRRTRLISTQHAYQLFSRQQSQPQQEQVASPAWRFVPPTFDLRVDSHAVGTVISHVAAMSPFESALRVGYCASVSQNDTAVNPPSDQRLGSSSTAVPDDPSTRATSSKTTGNNLVKLEEVEFDPEVDLVPYYSALKIPGHALASISAYWHRHPDAEALNYLKTELRRSPPKVVRLGPGPHGHVALTAVALLHHPQFRGYLLDEIERDERAFGWVGWWVDLVHGAWDMAAQQDEGAEMYHKWQDEARSSLGRQVRPGQGIGRYMQRILSVLPQGKALVASEIRVIEQCDGPPCIGHQRTYDNTDFGFHWQPAPGRPESDTENFYTAYARFQTEGMDPSPPASTADGHLFTSTQILTKVPPILYINCERPRTRSEAEAIRLQQQEDAEDDSMPTPRATPRVSSLCSPRCL